MTGCAKTEYVKQEVEVATVPPASLYESAPIPSVPEGVPPEERTDYLLEAYASRGDELKRSNERSRGLANWVELIQKLYPETKVVEQPPVD